VIASKHLATETRFESVEPALSKEPVFQFVTGGKPARLSEEVRRHRNCVASGIDPLCYGPL